MTVTEAGLYHLLSHSDNTSAKRFKRWLCREVLPSINPGSKDGSIEAQLAAACQQIHQLRQRLELAEFREQENQLAILSANERALWSERMNELSQRHLSQQRQTIAELTDQLTRTQQELIECQKIIVQSAHVLGVKAIEIHHQGDQDERDLR